MPQYNVNPGINHTVIQAETNNFVMPFWISGIIVLFMSVFIIYSSFNLIVNERIKIIGILRSIGCSRRKTNAILVSESMVIGLIGGTIGCIFGIGVLVLIKSMFFSANTDIVEGAIVTGAYEVVLTLMASVIITVLSAMLPIFRITKMPVKNIILNDYQKAKLKTGKYRLLGIVLMLPVVIVPFVNRQGYAGMASASLAFIMALIGLNLIIPAINSLASRIADNASLEIVLGVRNTGDFKALVNNTRLFAMIVAIMAVMITLFNTLGSDVRNTYRRHPYDIEIKLRESNPETLLELSRIDGVDSVYGIYQTYGKLPDHGIFMNGLVGVNGADYFDFFYAYIPPETITALNELKDNNMVTTFIFRDKLGLKLGDVLAVQVDEGTFDYLITGFLDTNWGIGHMGYISAETYKSGFGVKNYSSIVVKTNGSPIEVKSNILRTYTKDVLAINTKQEQEDANTDKIKGVFNSINTYSYFAMLIGLLGIINNMTACFLGRRRNIAMYRCIGMSKKSTGHMLMTEAVTIGIIGVLTGLITGILAISAIPFLVGVFWGNVAVDIPIAKISGFCIAGIAAMLLCSLIPSVMGKKISVMDNIRYE
jgi:putative ABC transport system permease protein